MEEAMNWLTYMNSSADVYYANLRRKHGHEKPYGVKYIGLGSKWTYRADRFVLI